MRERLTSKDRLRFVAASTLASAALLASCSAQEVPRGSKTPLPTESSTTASSQTPESSEPASYEELAEWLDGNTKANPQGAWVAPFAIDNGDGTATVRPFAEIDGSIECGEPDVGWRSESSLASLYSVENGELVSREIPSSAELIVSPEGKEGGVTQYAADCLTFEDNQDLLPGEVPLIWTNSEGEDRRVGGVVVKIVGNGQNVVEVVK